LDGRFFLPTNFEFIGRLTQRNLQVFFQARERGFCKFRLEAAGESTWDGRLEATGRALIARGVHRLPAIRVRRSLLDGDDAPAQAAALIRAEDLDRPLAPVG
jgi:hypothetical protein